MATREQFLFCNTAVVIRREYRAIIADKNDVFGNPLGYSRVALDNHARYTCRLFQINLYVLLVIVVSSNEDVHSVNELKIFRQIYHMSMEKQ